MRAMHTKTPSVSSSAAKAADHGRIVTESGPCLDSLQLEVLEREFRAWAGLSRRSDIILSRKRVLLVFLLIRYTGAKLHEVLALRPATDIDYERLAVVYGNNAEGLRHVPLSESLANEIRSMTAEPALSEAVIQGVGVDPAFIRRKFYERAQACGFPKQLGAPEMIRKSRGVELMQANMPLPAVQQYLGHSSPNLTSALVSFSENEIRAITSSFLERETSRKTSARNSFFGKITRIQASDIQALVELTTLGGQTISSIITLSSLHRLGLKEGRLATVEVKAPWVVLHPGNAEPFCSAENRLSGTIARITRGHVNTECVLQVGDNAELCIIFSTEHLGSMRLREGDTAWAVFSSYATILRVD
ncbi:MAG: TOBE domain-containing protein [Desulfovibrionales bacterium]|nr:TOBE domain-containing protein [Desulfovibrionales bacterium]